MWECKVVARPVLSHTANVLTIAESNRLCPENFEVSFPRSVTVVTLRYPKRSEWLGNHKLMTL
jgi:hypothetical protein